MVGKPTQIATDVEQITDSFLLGGGASERRIGASHSYQITVDCEARHDQVLSLMSRMVRWWASGSSVWVNGRKHSVRYVMSPVHVEADSPIMIVSRIQYIVEIDLYEERDKSVQRVTASQATATYNPRAL
jgi:hypothetical protein